MFSVILNNLRISNSQTTIHTYQQVLSMAEPFSLNFDISNYYIDKVVASIENHDCAVVKTHIFQKNDGFRKIDTELYFRYESIDWYRIAMLRKNVLSCAMSFTLAERLQRYDEYDYDGTLRVSLDEAEFSKNLKIILNSWEEFAKLKRRNMLNDILYFEDLTFDPQKDVALINLELQNVFNGRSNKSPGHRNIITNYSELCDIAHQEISNFSSPGINNNNGTFELL